MNLNDKNIDQLFRDAAQNSAAPRYDRAFWKEMSSNLNAHDKQKRGFLLRSLAGSFVSALLVVSLFLFNNESTNLSLTDAKTDSQSSGLKYDDSENSTLIPKINSNRKSSSDQIPKHHTNSVEISENSRINRKSKQRKAGAKLSLTINKSVGTTNSLNKTEKQLINRNLKERNTITQEIAHQISERAPDLSDENYLSQLNSLSAKDINLKEPEVPNELKPFKINNEKSINYYAKLSAGLMENYETSRPFQSGIFDISLNLEYRKEQVLFRTGLGFQMTSNADLVVSERAKVYGFGVMTHQNNLSYQSLYDIYVPIEIGYNLNNTSFGFGTQVNFMVSTSMNFESLENNVVVDKDKLTGFNDGLNSITAQGFVWVEQNISKRFAAGIKLGTHLNSRIKEGKYFNESPTTNPLYGQVILKYILNK